MRVLVLMQAATQDDIDVIVSAFPPETEILLLTGSNVSIPNGEIIKTVSHNPASLVSRLRCWLAYYEDVKKWASTEKNGFDLIYANSNPPINSLLGLKMKKKFGAPFVYMNWDIYPQIIEESYPNIIIKFICKFWHFANNVNYKKIDQMLTIGSVMADTINAPLKNKINIGIVPMYVDTEVMQPIPKEENRFIIDNGLQGKFIVLYSGKLGFGHNIGAILVAAEKLKAYKDILFLFIGKGPKCEEVNQAISAGFTNVKMMPFQPYEMVRFSMASGDIGIVSQEEKLAHLFLPSKTYSMLSCGLPVIGLCSERDDLKYLLESTESGIALSNASGDDVADAVLKLYKNENLRKTMSQKARMTIEDNYSQSAISKKYGHEFAKVITGGNQ